MSALANRQAAPPPPPPRTLLFRKLGNSYESALDLSKLKQCETRVPSYPCILRSRAVLGANHWLLEAASWVARAW